MSSCTHRSGTDFLSCTDIDFWVRKIAPALTIDTWVSLIHSISTEILNVTNSPTINASLTWSSILFLTGVLKVLSILVGVLKVLAAWSVAPAVVVVAAPVVVATIVVVVAAVVVTVVVATVV